MNQRAQQALKHTTADDGVFFIPFNEFAKVFNGLSVGQWGDQDQLTIVQASWDRAKPIESVKFALNNPVKQDVYLGLIVRNRMSQMKSSCTSSWTLLPDESFQFSLDHPNGYSLTDNWNQTMIKAKPMLGNDWMWFYGLEAGTYGVQQRAKVSES